MEMLHEFWLLVVDVWRQGLFGIDIGKIVVALAIFVGFLIIRQVFSRFVINRIKNWTKGTETEFDDHAIDALEKPIRFIPVVMGVFFSLEYLEPTELLQVIATNFERSLIAIAIFWALYNAIKPVSLLFQRLEEVLTHSLLEWLIKTIKIFVMLVGAATVLEIWGIKVAPLIAGLGLFGIAVALGAQDLFKNLIAGILVLSERRFLKGDWIKVEGVVEGTVESIGFRSTLIRRFDKAPVHVPNTNLADNAVTNFSRMTHRRIYWKLGVEYRTTVNQLRLIRDQIEAFVLGSDDFAHPPEVSTFVRIDAFNDSSIDIMLYCFTRTTDWGDWLEIKEDLAYRIKEIVEGAGTGFAFPSQSLYIETLPADQPEIFVPPSD
ncbi:MAG TPA: mechanosensitive ion channel family protein [Sneathiellales bacterium]|nr:mechanosensitive ion channel family protein [Sneathiellales bacterium]